MSTSAPIRREYDIPIVKPQRIPEEPRRLNPGVPAPVITRPVRVPERVEVRR